MRIHNNFETIRKAQAKVAVMQQINLGNVYDLDNSGKSHSAKSSETNKLFY